MIEVEVGHDMIYKTIENDYFEFIFHQSVMVPIYLYCEYYLIPSGITYRSVDCINHGNGRITM